MITCKFINYDYTFKCAWVNNHLDLHVFCVVTLFTAGNSLKLCHHAMQMQTTEKKNQKKKNLECSLCNMPYMFISVFKP